MDCDEVSDEEALQFKMAYSLQQIGLRMMITPEAMHGLWNDTRNAIRRSGYQYTLLLSTTIGNVLHGPWKSGMNRQTFQEAANDLTTMSDADFQELVENMMMDHARAGISEEDYTDIPESPDDIPSLAAVTQLPPFVTRL